MLLIQIDPQKPPETMDLKDEAKLVRLDDKGPNGETRYALMPSNPPRGEIHYDQDGKIAGLTLSKEGAAMVTTNVLAFVGKEFSLQGSIAVGSYFLCNDVLPALGADGTPVSFWRCLAITVGVSVVYRTLRFALRLFLGRKQ